MANTHSAPFFLSRSAFLFSLRCYRKYSKSEFRSLKSVVDDVESFGEFLSIHLRWNIGPSSSLIQKKSTTSMFHKELKGDCPVCAESNVLLVNLSKHCTHPPVSCVECHRNSIRTDIKSKGISSFECPVPTCKRKYEVHEYQHLIDQRLATIVDRLLLNKFLESDPEFRWCKSPKGCGAGQLVANHQDLLG